MQTLRQMMTVLKKERGYKKATLYQDLDNANSFNFNEEWKTAEDLERHLDSEGFRVLFGVLKVLCSNSAVTYNVVSQARQKVLIEP